MAKLNQQVLQSVQQVNAANVQAAPAQAMGFTFNAMAASISAHMQNAVLNQKSEQPVVNAAVSVSCALIMALSNKSSA